MGLIVQYWSTQSDNLQLSTVELGYKALSLFAVLVYPRVFDLARLARDQTQILATAMRYHYFGTKELPSVPVFTRQGGISHADCLRLCRLIWIVPHLNNIDIPTYYTHFDMFLCLKYPARLLVTTSRSKLKLVLDGYSR